MVVLSYSR